MNNDLLGDMSEVKSEFFNVISNAVSGFLAEPKVVGLFGMIIVIGVMIAAIRKFIKYK